MKCAPGAFESPCGIGTSGNRQVIWARIQSSNFRQFSGNVSVGALAVELVSLAPRPQIWA